jgi:hypothetical protein
VFDAFASLTAKPPGESQRQADQEEVQPTPQESALSADAAKTPQAAPADTAAPDQSTATAGPPVHGPEDGDEELIGPVIAPGTRSRKKRENEAPANLFEWEFKPAPAIRRNGLWLTLSVLLLICAAVQAAYIFRTDLMIRYPQLQPIYQLACGWLSCEIELPRLADQLNIDASDLQLVDPSRPNIVQLTALVRNRARVPVEYPAFELTLTNAQQQVVARRIFMPDDYLDDPAKAGAGLGGRQELAVNLYLDTGTLRAAGYRIYLFYPPPA